MVEEGHARRMERYRQFTAQDDGFHDCLETLKDTLRSDLTLLDVGRLANDPNFRTCTSAMGRKQPLQ
jgi:hypothetical protein